MRYKFLIYWVIISIVFLANCVQYSNNETKVKTVKKLPPGKDEIIVKALIDENGQVIKTDILSSTNPKLNNDALKYVKGLVFAPRWKNGRKVKYWRKVPVFYEKKSK